MSQRKQKLDIDTSERQLENIDSILIKVQKLRNLTIIEARIKFLIDEYNRKKG